MGTAQYFLVISFKLKMKCFVVVFAILASAAAESEPWLGYGYGGLGLGYGGYAGGLGYAAGYGYGSPVLAAAAVPAAVPAVAPVAAVASTATLKALPGVPTTSQYRKGDEYGNQVFGYNNPNSARTEGGNPAAGVVTGSYTTQDTLTVTSLSQLWDFKHTNFGISYIDAPKYS